MLPSNRPWDTLCPRAHCRRRRNCNLLIRSTLLSTIPYYNYSILSDHNRTRHSRKNPAFQGTARDSPISKNHRNRPGFFCGSFRTTTIGIVVWSQIRGVRTYPRKNDRQTGATSILRRGKWLPVEDRRE